MDRQKNQGARLGAPGQAQRGGGQNPQQAPIGFDPYKTRFMSAEEQRNFSQAPASAGGRRQTPGGAPGPRGSNQGRPNAPGPRGSNQGRPNAPGPQGPNYGRPNAPGPQGPNYSRPNAPGPQGSNQGRLNAPGPQGPNQGRPNAPGPQGPNYGRPNAPGPQGPNYGRPNAPGSRGPGQGRPGAPGPQGPNYGRSASQARPVMAAEEPRQYYPAQYNLRNNGGASGNGNFFPRSDAARDPEFRKQGFGEQPSESAGPGWQEERSEGPDMARKPAEAGGGGPRPVMAAGGRDAFPDNPPNLNKGDLRNPGGGFGGGSASGEGPVSRADWDPGLKMSAAPSAEVVPDPTAGWDDISGRPEKKSSDDWALKMSAKGSGGPGLKSGGAIPPEMTGRKKKSASSAFWFLAVGVVFLGAVSALVIYNYNRDAVVGENLPENLQEQKFSLSQEQIEEFTEKDPVSKRPVSINSPYRLDVYGTTFVFENERNLMMFVNDPLKYVKPKIKVRVSDVEQGSGTSNITIVGKDGRPAVEGMPGGGDGGQKSAENPAAAAPPQNSGGAEGNSDGGGNAANDSDFNIPLTPKDDGAAGGAPETGGEAGNGGAAPDASAQGAPGYGDVPAPGNGVNGGAAESEAGANSGGSPEAGGAGGGESGGSPGYGDIPAPENNIDLQNSNITDEEVVPPSQ